MTDRFDELWARRERLGLGLITLVVGGVLVYTVWQYPGTFVLGLFLYYVTRPIHDRIAPRFASRTVSVTLAVFAVTIPVLLLVVWTVLAILRAVNGFFGTQTLEDLGLPVDGLADPNSFLVALGPTTDAFLSDPGSFLQGELLGSLTSGLGSSVSDIFGAITSSAAAVFNAGLLLFAAIVLAFFLVRDDYRLAAWARSTVVREGGPLEGYLEAVDRDLHRVYFGNILNAVVTGVLGAVTFLLLNLVAPAGVVIPEPILFGLLGGAASLIPVIGIKLVWVPLAVVLAVGALLNNPAGLWFPVLFVVVAVVIVDLLPDQFLRPYVSGRSLHVGAVMLAYTFGPLMFGWYGIFLGPLLLVAIVECGRHLVPALVTTDAAPLTDDVQVSPPTDEDTVVEASDPDPGDSEPT
jgi:predicted PurR-regulated permease PerM